MSATYKVLEDVRHETNVSSGPVVFEYTAGTTVEPETGLEAEVLATLAQVGIVEETKSRAKSSPVPTKDGGGS